MNYIEFSFFEKLWLLTIFVAAVCLCAFLQLRSNRLTKEFYHMRINSIIVESSDWQKRSIDFYLANGVTINLLVSEADVIQLGDSIYKPSGTYIYGVYRKDQNQYKFLVSHNYKRINFRFLAKTIFRT